MLEQHGAHLPAWFAPVQVAILPVGAAHAQGAASLQQELSAAGIRVTNLHDDSLAKRIALAHEQAIPFQAVQGARELADGTVTLRQQKSQRSLPRAQAIAELVEHCRAPNFA